MHHSLARFSEPVSSVHAPSLADFITTTPVFKFSVHTTARFVPPVHDIALQSFRLRVKLRRTQYGVFIFRFALGLGHCSMQSACLKRARSGSEQPNSITLSAHQLFPA